MEEADMRLDGNAAAGVLGEIFNFETTVSMTTCANCGAVRQVGALHVYMRAPGVVIRCAACGEVQIRIVRASDRYWLDLTGVRCLEVRGGLAASGKSP